MNKSVTSHHLLKRPRRNRKSLAIRSLIQETYLQPHQMIAPLFVIEGEKQKQPIECLPHNFRFSIDLLLKEVIELYQVGIRAIDLFPICPKEKKDPFGTEALNKNNLMYRAISTLKKEIPEMCVMVDIALDPYTSHGHDGLVNERNQILNDETVKVLADMSVLMAEAGVDVVAPSDMMDGRIQYIRRSLDDNGFFDVSILSYAAKYASAFYGPFRQVLDSGVKFGDKKSYHMNPANRREALLEIGLDESEGADLILIKPALAYLDVIAAARQHTDLPIGAYHVSGEYAMIMAAAERGWMDADKALAECLMSIRRAGADYILTYGAKKSAELMQKGIFFHS